MKIIDSHKRRDYYDGAFTIYSDDIVYVRDRKLTESKPIDSLDDYLRTFDVCLDLLGFCGKVYTCVVTYTGYYSYMKWKVFFSNEAHDEYELNKYGSGLFKPANIPSLGIEKEIGPELFHQFNSPCFLYIPDTISNYLPNKSSTIITNPILTGTGFASLVNPYTAYQELEMFIGGVLRSNEVDTSIGRTDIQIRDAHGHGDSSFKTVSPGKKAKRRKK